MARKNEDLLRFRETSRQEFVEAITDDPADKFAKTFVAKADYQELWPVWGCWDTRRYTPSQLMGAISWTVGKRRPEMVNLQLLHTFAKYRRQGVATYLCNQFLWHINLQGLGYWRVSSEPEAVPFYESLGIEFLGIQKSGCRLAVARVGTTFESCQYDISDKVIYDAVHKKGKGGCVEFLYNERKVASSTKATSRK